MTIEIEDDGPGVPVDQIAEILQRGARLDEAVDGHGPGLAIARDLAELYQGDLQIGRSDLGGLSVTIKLRTG